MLIKLLKYDILADYKKYCAIYIAMLAASFMLLLSNNPLSDSEIGSDLFVGLIGSVFLMLSAAVAVMVLIFSISRFYKNLVRDEGYLMHTLPVPTWQLLVSKLITVYIWTISTVLMELICLSIAFKELYFFEFIFDLMDMLRIYGASIYIIYLVLSPFFFMSSIYLAIALGNLFSKNKLGMSVVMYFAIEFAESIVAGFVNAFVYVSNSSTGGLLNRYDNTSVILSIVLSLGYFIAAERIFAKRLNLE